MAIGAGRIKMLSRELEIGLVVVKIDQFPAVGVVARSTISHRPLMFIILEMARVTVCGSAFIYFFGMTIYTGDADMASGKRVTGLIMIKNWHSPVIGVVALGAIPSGAAVVFVVLLVTRVAVLRSVLQSLDGLCSLMAFSTLQRCVFQL